MHLMTLPNERKRIINGRLESPPPSIIIPRTSPPQLDGAFKHLDCAVNGEGACAGGAGYVSGKDLLWSTAILSSDHEQEISELQSNIRRLKRVKERIRSREEHISHVEGQAVALKEELLVLKLKWEEHEALKLENETLKTATQDLEVKAASHERTAAHLRNEKLSLGTLVDGLRLEIEKQKLKNVQLMSNENIVIDELKAELKRHKQETQSKIEALKVIHENGAVQTELGTQAAEAGVDAKEKELFSLRGLLKEARGAVEKTRTAFEESTGPRIAQLSKLRDENQLLLVEINELKEENESLASERADLKDQLDLMKLQAGERDSSMQRLSAENANLKASASRLAQKRILSSTAASAAGGGATCQENVEKLKSELRKSKSQVEASEKTIRRLEQQLAQMKNIGQEEELNNANATISKLRKTLERERREREHFSTARAALLDKIGAEKDNALTMETAWHTQVDGMD